MRACAAQEREKHVARIESLNKELAAQQTHVKKTRAALQVLVCANGCHVCAAALLLIMCGWSCA